MGFTKSHPHTASTSKGLLRRAAGCALLASLALSLAAAPGLAYADTQSAADSWSSALKASEASVYQPYSSDDSTSGATDQSVAGIEKYDLRDPNGDGNRDDSLVTSVKKQGTWETCWSFAATAASETSILSELRKSDPTAQIDLSELYLAWFAHAQAPEAYAGSSQAGEGFSKLAADSYILGMGGFPNFATTLFSAGVGPVSESVAPYKNKEGKIACSVLLPGAEDAEEQDLTEAEIAALPEGAKVTRLRWATSDASWNYYDWTVSESLYGTSEYQLEESYQLPSVGKFDDQGNYVGLNQEGIDAVKAQLLAGRAVATSSSPESAERGEGTPTVMNYDTWSQYATTADKAKTAAHAITIVGWDDNYSSENFLEGHRPSGNGAWLVKNSDGSSGTAEFPNEWGIQEDGEYTGYFWLSYYDETISDLVAFDFDVNTSTSSEAFIRDQYDYLPQGSVAVSASSEKTSSANEFTAGEDRVLRALTCQTVKPNTQVTYEVYLLDDGASGPTDGKLVLTKGATYRYGGFHRLMLADGEDQVAMRQGQRYSVVVTQKCGDTYYQVTTRNSNEGIARFGQWVSKINEGESWTLSGGAWSDWKTVSEAATKDTSYVVDNFPIKGLASARSWASVAELDELSRAIDAARAALTNARISADGSDVSEDETWMTQEQYDQLAAALADAEKQLALAGGDYKTTLANTTPSSAQVTVATASLAFTAQKGAAAAAGISNNDKVTGTKASALPTTGDALSDACAALAVAAAAALATAFAARRGHRWFGRILPIVVIALAFACMAPAPAIAEDDMSTIWEDAFDMYEAWGLCAYDAGTECDTSGLPESGKFDLRDPNGDGDRSDSVVTPVKYQSPWGSCWAFATISACETSILSAMGTTYAQTPIDLSERQLVNAVFPTKGALASVVGSLQAGEGFSRDGMASPSVIFESGGRTTFCMTVLMAGSGLVSESVAPYKNEENIFKCNVTKDGATEVRNLTVDQIGVLEAEGATVKKISYSGTYSDSSESGGSAAGSEGSSLSKYIWTDWSTDDELWGTTEYVLSNCNMLPGTAVLNGSSYTSTDMAAVCAVKRELVSGRAVTCAYHADESTPDEQGTSEYFDRTTWSHYTYTKTGEETPKSNHVVTIVGYDDSYSASNFKNSGGVCPEGDGAWLVKNSWGASTEDFPNNNDWGIVETDADGNECNTGYFWLSYYDQSICKFQSYDFDISASENQDETYLDQYDYLPQYELNCEAFDYPMSAANVFTASGDMTLNALYATTYRPNSTVTYQVYLLDDQATSPTDAGHSALVYTGQETYDYAGYHRIELPAADQVAMREGQRYAVVTTQRCNTDGKWYQGSVFNNGANAVATAKLNAGESYLGRAASADAQQAGDVKWYDWSVIGFGTLQVDNASIKARSAKSSWASVAELDELSQAIDAARAALANARISADGSDVSEDETWMTQEQHDQLAAALADAEAQLALAGGDYKITLVTTTPSSAVVTAATASLSFSAQKGGAATATPTTASDGAATGRVSAGKLAQTGDDAWPASVLAAVAIPSATLAALAARRVRRG